MNSGKVLLGFIVGVAVGAVLGVLFAPAKGSVTRKRITRKGTEYAEDVKEKFNEYIDALTEEYDTVKEGTMNWVDKGKEKAASVAEAIHAKWEKIDQCQVSPMHNYESCLLFFEHVLRAHPDLRRNIYTTPF